MNTRSLSMAPVALGAASVVLLLFLMFEPLATATEGLRTLITIAFWAVSIALVAVLYLDRKSSPEPAVEIQGPAFARFLFSDRRAGYFWLPIRLFLGLQWLEAGIHKFEDPAWMSGGTALRGYWERAVAVPAPPAEPRDHVRLVPRLPAVPDRQRRAHVVRAAWSPSASWRSASA